jgi:8-oxo-dGTP pyrophosphatase MutT (NUDIX family)
MAEAKNPWKILSKATVYENDWIRVDHHDVINPAGGRGVYGTVHFKCHATGIVPIDEQGNVILVGQYRFPLNAYSWEIPEGGSEGDGSALEAAQRELREECGVTAHHWLEIQQMDLSNSVSDEDGTMFLVWDLEQLAAQPDETEQIEIARVPFWDAVERVKRGEIRDGISIVALLRVAMMALQNELPPAVAERIARSTPAGRRPVG